MVLMKNILKRGLIIAILFIVGITMSFGAMTEEVSAASKKPSKVKISSISSYDYNAVKITWKKAKYAKKYQVYRATSKNGKYKLVKTTTSRSYVNKKLTTGKKYYYKVRGVSGSKKGSFSYKKRVIPKLKKTYGAKITFSDYNSISISWNQVNGAKGYQIYRAESKGGVYKKVKTTTAREFTNTALTTGKTYYYKVRAYRVVSGKYKYGAFSNAISRKCEYDMEKVKANYDNAQAELTKAESELTNANSALATAEAALVDAKEITPSAKAEFDASNEVLNKAKADYDKERTDAQKVLDDAQAAYDDIGTAFILDNCIKYKDNEGNSVDSLTIWKEAMMQNSSLSPYLGEEFDRLIKEQLTVDNLKKYMSFIDECNELRTGDNNFEGLGEFYVDYDLMLFSAISNVISEQAGTSNGHLLFEACKQNDELWALLVNASGNNPAENLAWGYSDPYKSWYDEEKVLYDKDDRSGAVGHYLEIVDGSYNTTGFSISNSKVSQQCFGYSSSVSLTTDGFIYALDIYIKPVKEALDNAKAEFEAVSNEQVVSAQADFDAKKVAYEKAILNESEAEKAVADSSAKKAEAEANVINKQKMFAEAEAMYNEALKYHDHEWVPIYKEVDNGHYETKIVYETYDKCSYCGEDVTVSWTNHFKAHALEGIPKDASCSAVEDYREVEVQVWIPNNQNILSHYECNCGATK